MRSSKGRYFQARSAIQEDASKTPPRRSTNVSLSQELTSAIVHGAFVDGTPAALVKVAVRRQRQECREIVSQDEPVQNLRRFPIARRAGSTQVLHLFVANLDVALTGDRLAVLGAGAVANPLPDLGPRDLSGSGVLHKVVDGGRSRPI